MLQIVKPPDRPQRQFAPTWQFWVGMMNAVLILGMMGWLAWVTVRWWW